MIKAEETYPNEMNVDHYDIQRSSNGRTFATIAKVAANNKSYNEYSYHDQSEELAVDDTWFRVQSVDLGGINYTMTRRVTFDAKGQLQIHPNPAKGIVNIEYKGLKEVVLTDVTVRTIVRKVVSATDKLQLNISNLSEGVYLVRINGERSRKLIVE